MIISKYYAKSNSLYNFAPELRFVAQLVEHVTLNHGVEGSSPSEPTIMKNPPANPGGFCFLLILIHPPISGCVLKRCFLSAEIRFSCVAYL